MPWSVFVRFERGQPGQMLFSVGSATADSTQLGRLAHFGNQFILVIACEGILGLLHERVTVSVTRPDGPVWS